MLQNKNPKIVVLGGGTGMPILLRGLKDYPIDLSTIVTVADDGGSTGEIRKQIEVPAPGDIRNVIAALSNVDEELYELFQYRIKGTNGLSGHALGNILLVATNNITGDFNEAVEKIAKLFNVKANIYPIVNESITLHAEMEDGTIVSGESNIPIKGNKIKRVFLTPDKITPNKQAIDAILEADLVVISPGSLYTSILPNLIMPDVVDAVKRTKASVVYVCNLMTQHGETDHYKASDHVKAIYRHIGENTIQKVIVNEKSIKSKYLQTYEREKSHPVQIDKDSLKDMGITVIEADVVDYSNKMIRHNNEKIASILYKLATDQMNKNL